MKGHEKPKKQETKRRGERNKLELNDEIKAHNL